LESDLVVEPTLSMSDELLRTKYKDKLEPSYKGLIHDVFTTILRALSGSKVTRPGKFRSCQDGYAVKSSLKAEDGILYPLEKSFFFLPKPPTLIFHDEVDYVEFQRHAAGGANMHYFDLLVKLNNEHEHLFRNIQRNEYHNLFEFIRSKGIKILNIEEVQATKGVAAVLQNDVDEGVDPHLERIRNQAEDETDEEDEDFVADKDDGGSPTDDSGGEESDGSDDDASQQPTRKDKQEASVPKASTKKKLKAGDDGAKKRKQKKKKDPNAPKGVSSSYMMFTKAEMEVGPEAHRLELVSAGVDPVKVLCAAVSLPFIFTWRVRKETPGKPMQEIVKILSNMWSAMSDEHKQPYVEKAHADKERYKDELRVYKNSQSMPMNVDSANESDA
ncbi:FACT complex subunit SSRP1-like protein, partial [Drosera capensis]